MRRGIGSEQDEQGKQEPHHSGALVVRQNDCLRKHKDLCMWVPDKLCKLQTHMQSTTNVCIVDSLTGKVQAAPKPPKNAQCASK